MSSQETQEIEAPPTDANSGEAPEAAVEQIAENLITPENQENREAENETAETAENNENNEERENQTSENNENDENQENAEQQPIDANEGQEQVNENEEAANNENQEQKNENENEEEAINENQEHNDENKNEEETVGENHESAAQQVVEEEEEAPQNNEEQNVAHHEEEQSVVEEQKASDAGNMENTEEQIVIADDSQPPIAPPKEPATPNSNVAPRPISQRIPPKENPQNIQRPPSDFSSYSYTYSYSEFEEEVTRPVRNRKKKIDYYPKYLIKTLRAQQQNQPSIEISDEELDMLKKRALNLQTLDDLADEVYQVIINSLIEDRNLYATQQNFKASQKYSVAIDHVSKCQLEQRKYNLQHESYNDMMDQMDGIKAQLQAFDNETNQMEADLRQKMESQIARIMENHEKELIDLQNKWNTENKMRQYNHASARLIFLRKQFKLYMRKCQFQEAEETKVMINRLEATEQDQAIKAIQARFDEAVAKVEAKQRDEIQFYRTRLDIRIKQLRQSRSKLREAITNRQRKVEQKGEIISDADKLWKYNQSQKAKNGSNTQRSIITEAAISRLTTRDLNEKEETTLSLPPLQLKRNQTRGTSVRSTRK